MGTVNQMLIVGGKGHRRGNCFPPTAGLYTFSRVGNLPLVVVIGQSEDEVYAVWRRNAWLVGSATSVLCLGILWLTWLLCRELRRRHRAEDALASLAATDGLTGLELDEAMETE